MEREDNTGSHGARMSQNEIAKKRTLERRKLPLIKTKKVSISPDSSTSTSTTGSSFQDLESIYKSRRISPFHKFDRFYKERIDKVNTDFPFYQRSRTHLTKTRITNLPEAVEEEDHHEDNNEPLPSRGRRISVIQDFDEFNERRKSLTARNQHERSKRHKSVDTSPRASINKFTTSFLVEELLEEEEEPSTIDLWMLRRKMKYCLDDIELNFGDSKAKLMLRSKKINIGKMSVSSIDQSILEDESENDILEYISSGSSSKINTPTMKCRNCLDPQKLFDRLEPIEETVYKVYDNMPDPIFEEKIENEEPEVSEGKKQLIKAAFEQNKFYTRLLEDDEISAFEEKGTKLRIRSLSYDQDPIMEDEKEHLSTDLSDRTHHCFRIHKSLSQSLFLKQEKKKSLSPKEVKQLK